MTDIYVRIFVEILFKVALWAIERIAPAATPKTSFTASRNASNAPGSATPSRRRSEQYRMRSKAVSPPDRDRFSMRASTDLPRERRFSAT